MKNDNWLAVKFKYQLVESALFEDYNISFDRSKLKNKVDKVNAAINEHRIGGHIVLPTATQVRDLQVV
jgi:hypothetical protein